MMNRVLRRWCQIRLHLDPEHINKLPDLTKRGLDLTDLTKRGDLDESES